MRIVVAWSGSWHCLRIRRLRRAGGMDSSPAHRGIEPHQTPGPRTARSARARRDARHANAASARRGQVPVPGAGSGPPREGQRPANSHRACCTATGRRPIASRRAAHSRPARSAAHRPRGTTLACAAGTAHRGRCRRGERGRGHSRAGTRRTHLQGLAGPRCRAAVHLWRALSAGTTATRWPARIRACRRSAAIGARRATRPIGTSSGLVAVDEPPGAPRQRTRPWPADQRGANRTESRSATQARRRCRWPAAARPPAARAPSPRREAGSEHAAGTHRRNDQRRARRAAATIGISRSPGCPRGAVANRPRMRHRA
jgi:hypothetical protein